jgi:hypothetical protein
MNTAQQWDLDLKVITAMRYYGGDFVRALAEAALRADADNLSKIKSAWPEAWSHYTRMAEPVQAEPSPAAEAMAFAVFGKSKQ